MPSSSSRSSSSAGLTTTFSFVGFVELDMEIVVVVGDQELQWGRYSRSLQLRGLHVKSIIHGPESRQSGARLAYSQSLRFLLREGQENRPSTTLMEPTLVNTHINRSSTVSRTIDFVKQSHHLRESKELAIRHKPS